MVNDDVTCQDAQSLQALVKKSRVPYVSRSLKLVLPSTQTFIPALDASTTSGLTGLGSAIQGSYTIVFKDVANTPLANKKIVVKVQHEFPEVDIEATGNGKVRVQVTKSQPWVYKYVMVVKGAPPEDVLGKPAVFPFVALVEVGETVREYDLREVLSNAYLGMDIPVGYAEVEVYAVPKLYDNDELNENLVKALELQHLIASLYNLNPKPSVVHYYMNIVQDENMKKLLQDVLEFAYELAHVPGRLIVEPPPAIFLGSHSFYMLRIDDLTSVQDSISINLNNTPLLDAYQFFTAVLSRLTDALKAYLSLVYYDAEKNAVDQEALNSDPYMQYVSGLKDKLENLNKEYQQVATGEQGNDVLSNLGSLLSAIFKGVSPKPYEKYIAFPLALYGGVLVDVKAQTESGKFVRVVGDASNFASSFGGGSNKILSIPQDIEHIFKDTVDEGIKKYDMRVQTGVGLKAPINVRKYLVIQEVGRSYDPVTWGYVSEVVVGVNRELVASELGLSEEEASAYTDRKLLEMLLNKLGVTGFLREVVFTVEVKGNIVDIPVPIGIATIVPSEVVSNRSLPAYPVFTEVTSTRVNKNPDVYVRTDVDKVRLLLKDWGYVQKLGFDMRATLVAFVSYQVNGETRTEIVSADAYYKNVLMPKQNEQTQQTLQVTVQIGEKRFEKSTTISLEGGYYVVPIDPIISALKDVYGNDAEVVPYLLMANLVPQFVWIPNISKYRYSDMTYRLDWPTIMNYFLARDLSELKLTVTRPEWVGKIHFIVYPVYATEGQPMIGKQGWKFDVDLSQETANVFTLDIRFDKESGIEIGSDNIPTVPYNQPVTLKLPAGGEEISGFAVFAHDDLLNPILFKPLADELATKVFEAVQNINVKVAEENGQYKLEIEGEDVTVEVAGANITLDKTALAGILQNVAFTYRGLLAYGVVPTESGYETDPYVAVNTIEESKIYATPYMVMTTFYLAPVVQSTIIEKIQEQTETKPYVLATPDALDANIPSLIAMAPPDAYYVDDLVAWGKDRFVRIVLNNQRNRNIVMRFYYTLDGQVSDVTTNIVELMGEKTTVVHIPLRDLAFLAYVLNNQQIASLPVPTLSINLFGQQIVLRTETLGSALRKLFQHAWKEMAKNGWSQYNNALQDPEFANRVRDLILTADSYNNNAIRLYSPALFEIVNNGIMDFGVDKVDVVVEGAILYSDSIQLVNGKGTLAGKDVYVKPYEGEIESPYVDITSAEKAFVQEHDLVNKIKQWYESAQAVIDESDAVFIYLDHPKKYTVYSGTNEKEYVGWEKFSVVSLIPILVKPVFAGVTEENVIRDYIVQALYDGSAVNLIKAVGHLPYVIFNINYNRPVRGGAENRTLIYRVDVSNMLIPSVAERINRMYILAGGYASYYFVDDRGTTGFVRITGFATDTDIILHQKDPKTGQGDLPAPLSPVSIRVRPGVTLRFEHPLVFPEPKLVVEADGFPNWQVDINVDNYYDKIQVEYYRGTTLVQTQMIMYHDNEGKPKHIYEKLELGKDSEFWRFTVYTYYLVAYTSKDRALGTTVLDEAGVPVYGMINIEPGPVSSATTLSSGGALQKQVSSGVQELITVGEYAKLWNLRITFLNDEYIGVIYLYNPVLAVEVDYDTRIVTAYISGVPIQIVNGIGFDSEYGPTSTGQILTLTGLYVPLSQSQYGYSASIKYPVLPKAITVYPVINVGEHQYIMPGVMTRLELRPPTVNLAYDPKTRTVTGQLTDWGYSPKVKVRVCGANTGVWCKDVCLEKPFDYSEWLKFIEGKTKEYNVQTTQPKFSIQLADSDENEPLMVVAFVYDGYGNLVDSDILKMPESRVYKAGGKYYILQNPAVEDTIITNNPESVLKLFEYIRQVANTPEGKNLPEYYAKGLVDDALTAILGVGISVKDLLNYDPTQETWDSYAKQLTTNEGGSLYDWLTQNYPGLSEVAFLEAYNMAKTLTQVLGWTADDVQKNTSYIRLIYQAVATGRTSPFEVAEMLTDLLVNGTDDIKNAIHNIGVSQVVTDDMLVELTEGDKAILATKASAIELDLTQAKEVQGLLPGTSKKTVCVAEVQPPVNAEPLKLLDYELYNISKKYGLLLGGVLTGLGLLIAKPK